MKLIGITGKARSGKDTIAKRLWSEYAFTRIAFADPLKLAAQHMFGLTQKETWDDAYKEIVIPHWGLTPRQIFQKLGTEASKPVFGNDVWVKRWAQAYELFKDTDHVVVPDVRFDEEASTLRALGGIIVEVRRGTGLVGSAGDHASERGLSTLPDYVIDNNDTMDSLILAIDAMIESME